MRSRPYVRRFDFTNRQRRSTSQPSGPIPRERGHSGEARPRPLVSRSSNLGPIGLEPQPASARHWPRHSPNFPSYRHPAAIFSQNRLLRLPPPHWPVRAGFAPFSRDVHDHGSRLNDGLEEGQRRTQPPNPPKTENRKPKTENRKPKTRNRKPETDIRFSLSSSSSEATDSLQGTPSLRESSTSRARRAYVIAAPGRLVTAGLSCLAPQPFHWHRAARSEAERESPAK
eukprot:scaffold4_cov247-Pinguiococcus_pyrenoidosus.AAC.11